MPTFQFAEGSPPQTLLAKMLAVVCIGIGVGDANNFVSDCTQEPLLMEFLANLNRIEIQRDMSEDFQIGFEDHVGRLRTIATPSARDLLDSEIPMAEFQRKASDIYVDTQGARELLPLGWKIERIPPVRIFMRLMAIDEVIWSFEILRGAYMLDGFRVEQMNAISKFDLLRLNIANRILELHGQEKATSASELVPEFFEEELVHPDTGEAYEWDAEAGEFVYEEAE
ncbi:MAG: hypothetical protein H6752_21460 [Candidatus Omnitrophica bacterium]|nr:hypothetical protein [Candidatus Omnitrophota bacterium]